MKEFSQNEFLNVVDGQGHGVAHSYNIMYIKTINDTIGWCDYNGANSAGWYRFGEKVSK